MRHDLKRLGAVLVLLLLLGTIGAAFELNRTRIGPADEGNSQSFQLEGRIGGVLNGTSSSPSFSLSPFSSSFGERPGALEGGDGDGTGGEELDRIPEPVVHFVPDYAAYSLSVGDFRPLTLRVGNELPVEDTITLDIAAPSAIDLSVRERSDVSCNAAFTLCNVTVPADESVDMNVDVTAVVAQRGTLTIVGTSQATLLQTEETLTFNVGAKGPEGIFSAPALSPVFLLLLLVFGVALYAILMRFRRPARSP